MSFLLKKKANGFGSRDPSVMPRILPPTQQQRPFGLRRTSTNGAGAGTTQLVRPKQAVMQNDGATAQGVALTMAEVMKDLRILEEQQKESDQKLQHARLTKQRRQAILATAEAQMQELKYSIGQKRAQLQRAHDVLGQGQRSLAVVRDAADNGRRDLDELEQAVRLAFETIRQTFAAERRIERHLEAIVANDKVVERLLQGKMEKVRQSKLKRAQLKEQEESLRRQCQHETSESQVINQAIAEVRSENSAMERELDATNQARTDLLQKVEDLKKQIADEDEQNQLVMASMEGDLESCKRSQQDKNVQLDEKQTQLAQATSEFHQSWECIIEIQLAEGHPPSQHYSVTNEPPVLDMARIDESVELEAKAAADEAAALSELETEVAQLKKELSEHERQVLETSKQVAELEQTSEEALRTQMERNQYLKGFIVSYKNVQKEVEKHRASVEEQRDYRDNELRVARELARDAKEARIAAQKAHDAWERELAAVKASLDSEKSAVEQYKHDHNVAHPEDIHKQAVQAERTYTELRAQYDCLEADNIFSSRGESEDIDLSADDLKAKSARLLQDFPALQSIDCVYDCNKTIDQQTKDCLKALRKDCNKRLDSARKMAMDLYEAEELERKERAKVEEAVKAERKRKDEAREERKKRLEAELKAAGDNDEEQKRRERSMRHKEKLRLKKQNANSLIDLPDAVSDTKPRDLLDSFSQESTDTELPLDDMQLGSHQKKVHWGDMGGEDKSKQAPSLELKKSTSPSRDSDVFGGGASFNGSRGSFGGHSKSITDKREESMKSSSLKVSGHDASKSVPSKEEPSQRRDKVKSKHSSSSGREKSTRNDGEKHRPHKESEQKKHRHHSSSREDAGNKDRKRTHSSSDAHSLSSKGADRPKHRSHSSDVRASSSEPERKAHRSRSTDDIHRDHKKQRSRSSDDAHRESKGEHEHKNRRSHSGSDVHTSSTKQDGKDKTRTSAHHKSSKADKVKPQKKQSSKAKHSTKTDKSRSSDAFDKADTRRSSGSSHKTSNNNIHSSSKDKPSLRDGGQTLRDTSNKPTKETKSSDQPSYIDTLNSKPVKSSSGILKSSKTSESRVAEKSSSTRDKRPEKKHSSSSFTTKADKSGSTSSKKRSRDDSDTKSAQTSGISSKEEQRDPKQRRSHTRVSDNKKKKKTMSYYGDDTGFSIFD